MSVSKLGRVAFGFTWDGLNTQLVDLTCGSRRKHHTVFQLCEEGIPERVILKHIQNTWDTNLSTGSLICGKRFIGKNPFIFVIEKVRDMILVLFLSSPRSQRFPLMYLRPPENLLMVRRQLLVHPRQFAMEVVYWRLLI